MTNIRILVAEDDTNIRMGLVDILESEAYRVTSCADGEQAMDLFHKNTFDLVLLDIMMPTKSGYDVCRDIRAVDQQVPIIMLTAKAEEMDKVIGLHSGADDYITKPFGIHELLARITAVLRRSGMAKHEKNVTPVQHTFFFGEFEINAKTFKMNRRSPYIGISTEKSNGPHSGDDKETNEQDLRHSKQEMDLSEREIKLIRFFHNHPGEVLSRDRLLNEIWGINYLGTTRTLDQHIAKLRKKIEPNPSSPRFITTVHGVGYRYEPC